MFEYNFYSSGELEKIKPIDDRYDVISNPVILFNILNNDVWSLETCDVRLQNEWSKDNPSKGQSVSTAFLVKEIFGGEVYAIKYRKELFHCFNVINGIIFDLTSNEFRQYKFEYNLKLKVDKKEMFDNQDLLKKYILLKNLLINKKKIRILGDRF